MAVSAAEAQTATLEGALASAEADTEIVLKAAERVVTALKKMRKAAREGDLRKLRAAPDAVRQSVTALDQEVSHVEAAWKFDDEAYLRDGGFVDELLAEARRQGLRLVLQDDRLYCYPVLISVAPGDRAVKIDRKPERRIRPSFLVSALRDRQRQQPRFRSAPFLESLWTAYRISIERQPDKRHVGSVVSLRDLYGLFTLMPGLAREYGLQEFARDVHLLDLSGTTTTKDGTRIEYHASTGTKSDRNALSIVTQNGAEKRYFGISFTGGEA
jgi:hypothetical protein